MALLGGENLLSRELWRLVRCGNLLAATIGPVSPTVKWAFDTVAGQLAATKICTQVGTDRVHHHGRAVASAIGNQLAIKDRSAVGAAIDLSTAAQTIP